MKNLIFILSLSVLVLFSCSSNNDTYDPEEVIEDIIRPPYTVRYEVTFSSNSVNDTPEISYAHEYPKGTWRISSAPGTLDFVSNSELIYGWSKEFTVTVDKNPLRIQCDVCYNPKANAVYNTKMYVNGKLVKDKQWTSSPSTSITCTFNDDHYDVY